MRIINGRRQLFAVSKDGYLVEVELMVKVHPEISNKIVFVGFIRKSYGFALLQQPK